MDHYHVIAITIGLIVAYLVSVWLVRRRTITLCGQRKFWNVLLLGTFAIAALGGLTLAILIEWELPLSWYRTLLWLHVEFGIGMTMIGIFHALWHSRYFLRRPALHVERPGTCDPGQT